MFIVLVLTTISVFKHYKIMPYTTLYRLAWDPDARGPPDNCPTFPWAKTALGQGEGRRLDRSSKWQYYQVKMIF